MRPRLRRCESRRPRGQPDHAADEGQDALKARIDKLATGGSTAGHLGTAWAWYLLSPNWNSLFPAASAAGPYSDLTVYNSKGMPKLRKIAVLMTDGDYNINYCKGVEAKNSDQSPDINCNSENGKSLAQAASLCSALKTAKIEVFAVGFQVSSAAKTFLTDLRHRRQPLLRRHDRRRAAGGLPRHRAQDRDAAADELRAAGRTGGTGRQKCRPVSVSASAPLRRVSSSGGSVSLPAADSRSPQLLRSDLPEETQARADDHRIMLRIAALVPDETHVRVHDRSPAPSWTSDNRKLQVGLEVPRRLLGAPVKRRRLVRRPQAVRGPRVDEAGAEFVVRPTRTRPAKIMPPST